MIQGSIALRRKYVSPNRHNLETACSEGSIYQNFPAGNQGTHITGIGWGKEHYHAPWFEGLEG
jgi:hypothetical protein